MKMTWKGLEIFDEVNIPIIIILISTIIGILLSKWFGFLPIFLSSVKFIYSDPPMALFIIEVVIGMLSIFKIGLIVKYKGMKIFSGSDEFLGIIGEIAIKGLIIITEIYTGFAFFGVILLNQLPKEYDISLEGKILVLLMTFWLFTHGIIKAYNLFCEVVIKGQLTTRSTINEIDKIDTNAR